MSQPLPKWMQQHVARCRIAFGLTDPHYHLAVDRLDRIEDDATTSARTLTTPRYLRARIEIRADALPDTAGYEDLTHELLHAAMPLHAQAVRRIIEQLPKPQRKHAWELWDDANEATVTRLARGLAPMLMKRTDKHGK